MLPKQIQVIYKDLNVPEGAFYSYSETHACILWV